MVIVECSGIDSIPRAHRSVAALVSCHCLVIVAAVIVLGLGALFLLFVVLFTLRVSSHSCETLRQLLHHPELSQSEVFFFYFGGVVSGECNAHHP